MTIKNYLKNNRPTISLLMVSIFFVSNILTITFDALYWIILLFPQDIKSVWTWYKLLTYPFYGGGLFKWLHSAIVIVLAGYIIEHRFSKGKVIALMILSSIVGGLIFSVVNLNDPLNTPIASPTMIAWSVSSCAFICIVRQIKTSILFEKIVAVLFIVSILSIQFIDFGFLMGQIGVIVLGLLFGFIFDDKEKDFRIIDHIPTEGDMPDKN